MRKITEWPAKWLMLLCLLMTGGHVVASDWTEGGWYYLYNVDAGQFLMGANDWGTRASVGQPTSTDMFQVNTLPNGFYQLKWKKMGNGVFIEGNTNAWVDMASQGHNDWQLTKQTDGSYLISINPNDADYGIAAQGKTYLGWEGGTSTIVRPLLKQNGRNYGGSWLFLVEGEYEKIIQPRVEMKAQMASFLAFADKYSLTVDEAIRSIYEKPILSVTLDELEYACEELSEAVQVYADEQAENGPLDVTDLYIKNPTCESAEHWVGAVQNGSQKPKFFAYQGSTQSSGGVTISKFLENWTSFGNSLPATGISQELTSVVTGKYTLEADAIATQQKDESLTVTGVNLFATGTEKNTTACSTGNEAPEHYAVNFMVIDEVTVIGFEVLATNNANWVAVDNFKLYYNGVDVPMLKEALRRSVVKAEEMEVDRTLVPDPLLDRLNTAIVNARQAVEAAESKAELRSVTTELRKAVWEVKKAPAAVEALQNSIAIHRGILDDPTGLSAGAAEVLRVSLEAAENWKSATSVREVVALENALSDYKTIVAAYQEARSVLDAYISIAAQFAESEISDSYKAALEAVAAKMEIAMTVSQMNIATQALGTALCTWLPQGKPLNGAFDLTALIKNHDFGDNTATGWVTTYPITVDYYLAEVYQQAFTMNQVLVGMPAGSYQLRMQGFQRTGSNEEADVEYVDGTAEITASFSLNDAKQKLMNVFAAQSDIAYPGDILNATLEPNYPTSIGKYVPNNMSGCEVYMNNGFYWNSLSYTLPEDGDLTIGVENTTTRAGSWTVFDNFKLFYAPAEIQLDENSATYPVSKDVYAAKVTTNRTLKGGQWSTLCLPFDLDVAQVANAGISEVKTLSGVTTDGDMGFVTFAPSATMKAGKPYLVKAVQPTTLSFDDVLVKAAAPEAVEMDGVMMLGSYCRSSLENAYYISGDKFYFADVPVASKGFRASIVLTDAAAVKSLVLRLDDVTEVEGIKAVADGNARVDVYTLDGVRVKSNVSASQPLDGLHKGIYIVNGKKVVK